jgi:hypothetical protein
MQIIDMKKENLLLWDKIKEFELDDPNSSMTFTDRLAKENGWTHEFSVRAILEYKRFLFLICVSGQPLTPSDEVDQVWHLHLLYTHSYWDELCGSILKKKIHHGPTKGGHSENQKFTNWYIKTLELYKRNFKQDPPVDIWPSNEVRFRNVNFQRVNMESNWIIKKPF